MRIEIFSKNIIGKRGNRREEGRGGESEGGAWRGKGGAEGPGRTEGDDLDEVQLLEGVEGGDDVGRGAHELGRVGGGRVDLNVALALGGGREVLGRGVRVEADVRPERTSFLKLEGKQEERGSLEGRGRAEGGSEAACDLQRAAIRSEPCQYIFYIVKNKI